MNITAAHFAPHSVKYITRHTVHNFKSRFIERTRRMKLQKKKKKSRCWETVIRRTSVSSSQPRPCHCIAKTRIRSPLPQLDIYLLDTQAPQATDELPQLNVTASQQLHRQPVSQTGSQPIAIQSVSQPTNQLTSQSASQHIARPYEKTSIKYQ